MRPLTGLPMNLGFGGGPGGLSASSPSMMMSQLGSMVSWKTSCGRCASVAQPRSMSSSSRSMTSKPNMLALVAAPALPDPLVFSVWLDFVSVP